MSTLNSIDMLTRLVAFPTVSRDPNLPLIDWVEEYLERFGARCRRTWNAERTKANLFAAVGPDAPGGVVLSGHTDVVPVDGIACLFKRVHAQWVTCETYRAFVNQQRIETFEITFVGNNDDAP